MTDMPTPGNLCVAMLEEASEATSFWVWISDTPEDTVIYDRELDNAVAMLCGFYDHQEMVIWSELRIAELKSCGHRSYLN